MQFELGETFDDQLLADFYDRHWRAMGSTDSQIAADWRETALQFIATARQHRSFAGFCAQVNGVAVGSACCHMIDRVYPAFHYTDAPTIGYIWGVYVEPTARQYGIGAALVDRCIQHLRHQGCGRVLLHASEQARSLYHRLGFVPTDELGLYLHAQ